MIYVIQGDGKGKTTAHAIDTVVNVIVSAFGHFLGDAAYTVVMGSTFMSALSGRRAGNVEITDVFSILAMKKSDVPAHLAANIESACSILDNMIPPDKNILCVWVFKTYLSFVVKITSVFTGIDLLGMNMSKQKALLARVEKD
jgi:TRAP-type C4-dicarboxylate transport system permease large subunit